MLALNALPPTLAGYRERGILRRLADHARRAGRVLAAQLIVNFGRGRGHAGRCCSRWPGSRSALPLPRQLGGFVLTALLASRRCSAIGPVRRRASRRPARAADAIGTILFFPMMFFAGLWLPIADDARGAAAHQPRHPARRGGAGTPASRQGHWPHPLQLVHHGRVRGGVRRWPRPDCSAGSRSRRGGRQMSHAHAGLRLDARERRRAADASPWCRTSLLALLAVITGRAPVDGPADLAWRSTSALCARRPRLWMLWLVHAASAPGGSAPGRLMAVFFVGLIAIMAVMVVRDPWFGFFTLDRVLLRVRLSVRGRGGCRGVRGGRRGGHLAGRRPAPRTGAVGADRVRRPSSLVNVAVAMGVDLVRLRRPRAERAARAAVAELSEANRQARSDARGERRACTPSCSPRPGRPGSSTSGSGWPGRSTTPWPRA